MSLSLQSAQSRISLITYTSRQWGAKQDQSTLLLPIAKAVKPYIINNQLRLCGVPQQHSADGGALALLALEVLLAFPAFIVTFCRSYRLSTIAFPRPGR